MQVEDTEAPRQVRRLQSELAQAVHERDGAYEALEVAGEKARQMRADIKVYRDQAERLSQALTEIAAQADDEQVVKIARTAQAEAIGAGDE